MQIVIDIPEKIYKAIQDNTYCGISNSDMYDAIRNGTPLPKGHGGLVDKSKICKAIPAEEDNCTGMGMTLEEMEAYNDGVNAMYSLVQGASVIIEADKEVDE